MLLVASSLSPVKLSIRPKDIDGWGCHCYHTVLRLAHAITPTITRVTRHKLTWCGTGGDIMWGKVGHLSHDSQCSDINLKSNTSIPLPNKVWIYNLSDSKDCEGAVGGWLGQDNYAQWQTVPTSLMSRDTTWSISRSKCIIINAVLYLRELALPKQHTFVTTSWSLLLLPCTGFTLGSIVSQFLL